MIIRCKLFTTSANEGNWIEAELPYIIENLKKAKGVTDVTIDVERIELLPGDVPLMQQGNCFFPSWDWFRFHLTAHAPGYNAVGLHMTNHQREALGIKGFKGVYSPDPDDIFEFFVSADKGERSEWYWHEDKMTEFARVFIHELGGHGFEMFTRGYHSDFTHQYDYGPGGVDHRRHWLLPRLTSVMDFTEWDKLHAKRDGLLAWIKAFYQNVTNFPMKQTLLEVCKAHLGTDVTPDDLVPDVVACAITVSTLIHYTDATFPKVAGTATLHDIFEHRRDWKSVPVEDVKPGDVVLAATGSGNGSIPGHVGVMGDGGRIMSNSSPTGLFIPNYTMETFAKRYTGIGGMELHVYRKIT